MKKFPIKTIYQKAHPCDDIRRPIGFVVVDRAAEKVTGPRHAFSNPVQSMGTVRAARTGKGKHPIFARLMPAFAAVLLIAVGFSFTKIGATVSYFSDSEQSLANALKAGHLGFSVTPAVFDMTVGLGTASSTVIIPDLTPLDGSFVLAYRVTAEKSGGSDPFCNALLASATTSPFTYGGPLLSLTTGTTTTPGTWQLGLSLPADAPGIVAGDLCSVDLIYSGWIEGQTEGHGYQDEQRVSLNIHADVTAPELLLKALNEDTASTTDETATTTTDVSTSQSDAEGIATSTEETNTGSGGGGGGAPSNPAGANLSDPVSTSTTTPPTTDDTNATSSDETSGNSTDGTTSTTPPTIIDATTTPPVNNPPAGDSTTTDPATDPVIDSDAHNTTPAAPPAALPATEPLAADPVPPAPPADAAPAAPADPAPAQ